MSDRITTDVRDLELKLERENTRVQRLIIVVLTLVVALTLGCLGAVGWVIAAQTNETSHVTNIERGNRELLQFVADVTDPNSKAHEQSVENTARILLIVVNEVRSANGLPTITLEQMLEKLKEAR